MAVAKITPVPARRQPFVAPGRTGTKPTPMAGSSTSKTGVNDPVAKLRAVLTWVSKKVVGRDDCAKALVLGLVAKANVLLLGVPGTAKTMLVESVASSFTKSDVFSIMLSKFTKPAEVFGPVDIAALEQSQFKVCTDGYLPTARVGVIDEVFKASSAILNSLLTIANERRFKNGTAWDACPTQLLVGMSNEFPEDAAVLAAFFDRFPVKLMVPSLDDDGFQTMMARSVLPDASPCPVSLTDDDFAELDRRLNATTVDPALLKAIVEAKGKLKTKGIVVSDRRWVQGLRLMRAEAVLAGRTTVTRRDAMVLKMVVWDDVKQLADAHAIVAEMGSPAERDIKTCALEVYALRRRIRDAAMDGVQPGSNGDMTKATAEASVALGKIRQTQTKLDLIESNNTLDETELELMGLVRASVDEILKVTERVASARANLEELMDTAQFDVGAIQ